MNELELEYEQGHAIDPDTHPFELHPQLAADCFNLGAFPLCDLLLMNDANYPWFILVPRRADVSEIYHLAEPEQQQLLQESSFLAENLRDLFCADKINIATLGNMVPQLHLHVIARYRNDPAWPRPVWGALPSSPYAPEQVEDIRRRVTLMLAEGARFTPAM